MGCCGPMMGPGCNVGGCNDCDGLRAGANVIPNGPLDGLRQLKRQLTCGSGCGEVYVDEWISTPPDCTDPCCDDQWVGGAVKARPLCWERGTLINGLMSGAFGGRYCTDAESSAPCDCGSCDAGVSYTTDHAGLGGTTSVCASGGCASGGCASGNCGGRAVVSSPIPLRVPPSAAGCSSGNCGIASGHANPLDRMRVVGRKAGEIIQASTSMDARVNRIRQ